MPSKFASFFFVTENSFPFSYVLEQSPLFIFICYIDRTQKKKRKCMGKRLDREIRVLDGNNFFEKKYY